MTRRWKPIVVENPKRPWTMPGYKGKLRQTPSVNLRDYLDQELLVDDCVEAVLEMMIDDQISRSLAEEWLNYYDELREKGFESVPDDHRLSSLANITCQLYLIMREIDNMLMPKK